MGIKLEEGCLWVNTAIVRLKSGLSKRREHSVLVSLRRSVISLGPPMW